MAKLMMLLGLLCMLGPTAQAQMVDPAIDANGPFCYLAKSSTTLGVMAGPEGAQVTFDGALYTGQAELCFFYGDKTTPLLARGKELLLGWLPVVEYGWRDGALAYHLEAFGVTLDGKPTSNTVLFAQVRVTNLGDTAAAGTVWSALRYCGGDHRAEGMTPAASSPNWTYAMAAGRVLRDGKLVYTYPQEAELFAVPGVAYGAAFAGRTYSVTERAEVCLSRVRPWLEPGQSASFTYRMPLEPTGDTAEMAAIQAAEYDEYLGRTVEFWTRELGKGTKLTVPEDKVLNTHRASLVYDMIAIDQEGDDWVQKVNEFQYDWFWLRDGYYIARCYDVWGHHETARRVLEYFRRFQQEDGLFSSQSGQLDGYGQGLWGLVQHALISGDEAYARDIWPHIPPAVEWLRRTRAADEYHLMPPTNAHDNEMIEGRYTGHNFWALGGLRGAILLARMTGHEAEAKAYEADYADFHAALMKRLREVCGEAGAIPPGLDVEGGQDWGNLLGVFPTATLAPDNPWVTATLEKMHREKYAEGIMTWLGMLHHYVTINVAQTHVARGEAEQALRDFYALLLHTGSCQEGFELGPQPWVNREVGGNFPPHGWCAAQINNLLRNMLVMEQGGEGPGGALGTRELHLFSVVSPAWDISGQQVALDDAPTDMGPISTSLKFTDDGAVFSMRSRFRTPPAAVVLHVPYFAKLTGLRSDAREARIEGGRICFSPDVTEAKLTWTRREVEPLSYAGTVEAHKAEYARRVQEARARGEWIAPVEAPAVMTAAERKASFDERWGPETVGIAVGCPVTTNGGTEQDKAPERAVDGNARDKEGASWWAGPPTPRWLQVDLRRVIPVSRVIAYPYWDGGRYYQYKVEVSADGTAWECVADRSNNTQPATPQGDTVEVGGRPVRYVRVTMLRNSANPSVHLVELRVFGAK